MVFATLFLAVAIAWAYFLWSRRKLYMFALKMKGPWGYPLIGILHKIYKLEEFSSVLFNYCKTYKTRSCFTFSGTIPILYTNDPAIVDIVLHSPDCLTKAYTYKIVDDAVGNGLLTNKTPKWNMHRRLLAPSVGYKILMAKMEEFNKYARDFCKEIDSSVERGNLDIKPLTLVMVARSAIGITVGNEVEADSKIVHAFENIVKSMISRAQRPWLFLMPIYKWSSGYKPFLEARTTIRDYIEDLARAKLKANAAQGTKVNGKVSHVFLDHVISLYEQKEFIMEDVIDEVSVMVLGSFETTATTICFMLVYMAMHPEIQERVFEEISTLYNDRELEVTYDNLKEMVYLEMCINETMRLTPPIPILGRECGKDVPISDDITIPAGTEIIVDIFNLHRDVGTWGPLANTYNPDHFLPSNLHDKPRCAFIPFSKGKRNCFGWQFAGMFLKVVLTHILRKYKFSTTARFEDMKAEPLLSMNFATMPILDVQRR